MLEVRGLSLTYGQSQILHAVSFTAPVGQVTTLMGTNGVGKTSLLRALSGRHPYTTGEVILDGVPLDHVPAVQAARAGIAYVPQGREVFPMMSVAENLETGFACLSGKDHGVPDWIFELFPVLRDMKDRRGGDLSGGQQQQLAIARALITRPKVLLLDEPTEGIQPNVIQQIGAAISRLRDRGDMAIVLVEQNVNFAHRAGDHFVMMKRGEVFRTMARDTCTRDDLIEALAL